MRPRVSKELTALLALVETETGLEALLRLRRSPGKSFTASTVGRELSVTTASAERELALLCGRGFLTVSLGSDLRYAYRPMTDGVDGVLAELERLWESDRDLVLRSLPKQQPDPIRAFANAFRFRPGGDDDDG